jgi:uncharacterized protein
MLNYFPRHAASILRQALEVSPVVAVMGARQTGKSTLVRNESALADHAYLTLDDLDVAERARLAPEDLVRSAPRLILDEVQRAPHLIHAIKRVVDETSPRRPGQFVLTGSANLLLMQRVSETLAGRATYLTVWPLTRSERAGQGGTGFWDELFNHPVAGWLERFTESGRGSEGGAAGTGPPEESDWREQVRTGGYPVPALELKDDAQRTIWFDGYVRTYLERDLQDLAAIDNLVDFRRLMKMVALRLGTMVNQAELGRDGAISRPTVHRYMNLLETSWQLVRLEPYFVNPTRRMVKSPKAYWSDSGLALHLGGGEPGGAFLENMVLGDLLAWRDGQIPRPGLYYWRTATDLEVDFVIEHRGAMIPVEVKASARPASADVRGLAAFRDDYPDTFRGGLLLHTGTKIQWFSDRILAIPWSRVI